MSSGSGSGNQDVALPMDIVNDVGVDDFDDDTSDEETETLEAIESVEAAMKKMDKKKYIFPRDQLLKKKKSIITQREKDVKNYNKAKQRMREWYRKMRFLEGEIKAADQEIAKIDGELLIDFNHFGFY